MSNSDTYGTRARILNNYLSEWTNRGYVLRGKRLEYYDAALIRRVNRANAKELKDAEVYMRRSAGGYAGAYARTKNTRFASLKYMILRQREAILALLRRNEELHDGGFNSIRFLEGQKRVENQKITLVSDFLAELARNWSDTRYYFTFSKLFLDIKKLIRQLNSAAQKSIGVVDLEYSVYAHGTYVRGGRILRKMDIKGLKIVRVGTETPVGLDEEDFWRRINNQIKVDIEKEGVVEQLLDEKSEEDSAFSAVLVNMHNPRTNKGRWEWSVGSENLPTTGGVLKRDAGR